MLEVLLKYKRVSSKRYLEYQNCSLSTRKTHVRVTLLDDCSVCISVKTAVYFLNKLGKYFVCKKLALTITGK